MRNPSFLQTVKYSEQQFRALRDGAHEDILLFEAAFQRRMSKLGIPMFAHCVWRSHAEQDRLKAAGRSKASAGQSAHNFGCAIDYVHSTKAWGLSEKEWLMVGHIGKEVANSLGINIVWGGDWKFYDPAHWELANWREQAKVRPLY